jgi:hypothetical protein
VTAVTEIKAATTAAGIKFGLMIAGESAADDATYYNSASQSIDFAKAKLGKPDSFLFYNYKQNKDSFGASALTVPVNISENEKNTHTSLINRTVQVFLAP